MTAWSYSSISTFKQCPKKYYHLKVAKDVRDTGSEAMLYGNQVHKAAEHFIKDGTPIPKKFEYLNPIVNSLNAIEGDKHCELRFGISYDGEKHKETKFFAKDVWFRGIVDLAIIDKETGVGWIIDYKTGKSAKYADKGQLELMALAIFKHYPEVTKLHAGLLFVIAKSLVKAEYEFDAQQLLWSKWLANYAKMEKAFEVDVWNPKPSGLCKRYCQVVECHHNGAN